LVNPAKRQDQQTDGKSEEWPLGPGHGEQPRPLQPADRPRKSDPQSRPKSKIADHGDPCHAATKERQHGQHDGQGQSIVQAALDVEQVSEAVGHFPATNKSGGEDGIGRTEDRADQEGLGPGQASNPSRHQRRAQEGQRQPQQQGSARQSPA
jgi:hypothetical protein